MATGTPKKPVSKKAATPAQGGAATLSLVPAEGLPTATAAKTGALKKKDLIERVIAATGGKKKDVKEVVEVTLAVLGAALQGGEGLNLPPFGKARVAKSKGEGTATALTVKLRGAGAKKDRKQPLADAGEDG